MPNGTITIDQFNNILKRLEKLEHREIGIEKLEEDYHTIKKDVAITDTKLDSFAEKRITD